MPGGALSVLDGMTSHHTALAPQIRDNAEEGRYEILVNGDVAGFVDYHRSADRMMIPRTVTLPAYRGQGFAGMLVQHVMDQARSQGRSVTTSCWYVRDWLAAHPDYRDLQH